VAADAVPGAAAVDEDIARFSGRAYTRPDDLLARADLDDVRVAARDRGSAEVLDLAVDELRSLARVRPTPRGPRAPRHA
jgi:hypothetical protein